ncbi:MAG: alpha/beta fold hydrolase [Gemmatimonadota bacterium]
MIWSLLAYRASSEAREAVLSNSLVSVSHQDGVWTFTPVQVHVKTTGFMFLPGALVDPRAYAPLARSMAEKGYRVALIELPRRGAFGGADSPEMNRRISTVFNSVGLPRRWVVGGHSRGAVVASRVASQNQDVAGLVIIGSSHPRDYDLSSLRVPVTKVVGTRDGLASPAEVRENAPKLPPQTRWVWIEGGNHSQFGWYGFQPMDRVARIDASDQRAIMIQEVAELLDRVTWTSADSSRKTAS